jgi:hypothetical protein
MKFEADVRESGECIWVSSVLFRNRAAREEDSVTFEDVSDLSLASRQYNGLRIGHEMPACSKISVLVRFGHSFADTNAPFGAC